MNTGWGQHIADDPADYDRDYRFSDFREQLRRSAISERRQNAPQGEGRGIDLRQYCSPVRDQGLLESCVGFALAALLEFLQKQSGQQLEQCSPHFIWSLARRFEFNAALNVGAQIRNGLRVLTHIGCSPEQLDPYDPIAFIPPPRPSDGYQVEALLNAAAAREPNQQAIAAASKFKIDAYYRLNTLQDFKDCLDDGHGFVMSCPIFASAIPQAIEDGRLSLPKSEEAPVASHTVFVAGYDEDPDVDGGGYLIAKGSQGKHRGDHGYFLIPFAYAESNEWHLDGWTAVHLAE